MGVATLKSERAEEQVDVDTLQSIKSARFTNSRWLELAAR